MTKSPDGSLHKHIRVSPAQWERIERAAEGSPHSPNQVLVELAMEALDRREWPATDTEMRVARASLFAAQASLATSSPTGASRRFRKSARSSRPSCPTRTANSARPTPTNSNLPLKKTPRRVAK